MTPENIKEILENIINNKFQYYWIYLFISIGITVIVSTISAYAMSFLKEKGKNLAIKEDITDITRKIENIKNENSEKLESIRKENSEKLESIKNENLKSFNLIQNKNDARFSELKNTKDRFNSKQFEIYNTLWTSLIELKFSADDLWEDATQTKLRNFSKKISETKKAIETSSLLLEDIDYTKLKDLLKQFNNFEFGKENLIKLYKIKNKTNQEMSNYYISDSSIDNIIKINEQIKNRYDDLISNLRIKFKIQLQGNK